MPMTKPASTIVMTMNTEEATVLAVDLEGGLRIGILAADDVGLLEALGAGTLGARRVV